MTVLAQRADLAVVRNKTRPNHADVWDTLHLAVSGDIAPERRKRLRRLARLPIQALSAPVAWAGKGCDVVTLLQRPAAV